MRVISSVIALLCLMLSVWVLGRTYVVDIIIIRGHSMEPTLYDGDKIWVNKMSKYTGGIRKNDLVVFKHPSKDVILCKRCVAGPGDSITYTRSPLDTTRYSSLLYAPSKCDSRSSGRNAHDWYYFLGDNRDHSVDSRHFGLVPDYDIIGKVLLKN